MDLRGSGLTRCAAALVAAPLLGSPAVVAAAAQLLLGTLPWRETARAVGRVQSGCCRESWCLGVGGFVWLGVVVARDGCGWGIQQVCVLEEKVHVDLETRWGWVTGRCGRRKRGAGWCPEWLCCSGGAAAACCRGMKRRWSESQGSKKSDGACRSSNRIPC
eukprot:1143419-Pelagomonas_calceolata.AAC.4